MLHIISLIMSPSAAIFKSILGNDVGKFAKHCGLKFVTDIVVYEERDCKSKVLGPVKSSACA